MMFLHFFLHEILRIPRICILWIQLDWKRQPCAQSAISRRDGIASVIFEMQQPNLSADVREGQKSENWILNIFATK